MAMIPDHFPTTSAILLFSAPRVDEKTSITLKDFSPVPCSLCKPIKTDELPSLLIKTHGYKNCFFSKSVFLTFKNKQRRRNGKIIC